MSVDRGVVYTMFKVFLYIFNTFRKIYQHLVTNTGQTFLQCTNTLVISKITHTKTLIHCMKLTKTKLFTKYVINSVFPKNTSLTKIPEPPVIEHKMRCTFT